MLTLDRWVELLPRLLLYFAPTLVGWLRVRSGRARTVPLGWLFAVNLLFGWTGIGWLALWPLALGWWVPRVSPGEPETRVPTPPQDYEPAFGIWDPEAQNRQQASPSTPGATPPGWPEPVPEATCPACGNQGQVCPSCHGSQGTWIHPQTDSGTSTWQRCDYCTGRGRVQCGTCGRTG